MTRNRSFQGSPLTQHQHHEGDDDDDAAKISAPNFPVYPNLPDPDGHDDDVSGHRSRQGDEGDILDGVVGRNSPSLRRKSESKNDHPAEEDAVVVLNAADRSFLENFREEENTSGDDGDDDDEDDGDGLRYDDRPMWRQVLGLDDQHERDDDDDGHGAFGVGGARGLMIGPLLPAPENTTNITANPMLQIRPSLLERHTPMRDSERSTLHEFAELTALTHDMGHPQLQQGVSFAADSNEGMGETTRRTVLTGTRNTFSSVEGKTRDIFLEGRTPPRKRKFDLIMNSDGDVESIMLDKFKPPSQKAQRISQTNQSVKNNAGQQTQPITLNMSRTSDEKYDLNQHFLDSLQNRESGQTMVPKIFPAVPLTTKHLPHNPNSNNGRSQGQPQSIARKRWDFVVSEQSKVKKTLEKARVDSEQANRSLKEAEEQYKSVKEVIQRTCKECYSFLIQEDTDWYEGYRSLQDYHSRFGNTLVPRNYHYIKKISKAADSDKSENSTSSSTDLAKLSRWVGAQRSLYKKGELEEFKVYALSQLNFDFDPAESRWNAQYQALVKFVEEQGHARVPYNYGAKNEKGDTDRNLDGSGGSDDNPLGAWVKRQQYQYKLFQEGSKSELTLQRIRLLNDVGMVWNRREASWMDRIKELEEYKFIHGHINVPSKDKIPLWEWLQDQRAKYNEYKRNPLQSPFSDKQIRLLQKVGIEENGRTEGKWSEMFEALSAFRSKHGHCMVSKKYPKNHQLSIWCDRQRQQYQCHLRGQCTSLTQERINRLKSIGFEFDTSPDCGLFHKFWNAFHAELTEFKKENGHTKVDESSDLGQWLTNQRNLLKQHREGKAVDLSPEQIEKLISVLSLPKKRGQNKAVRAPGDERGWEAWFGDLLAHRIHAKTFRLPQTESFLGLKNWVEEQRIEYAKYMQGLPSKLTYERVLKLQRAKFPFNLKIRTVNGRKTKLGKSWEEHFTDLLQFHLLHDSFSVPEENSDLYQWIEQQQGMYLQRMRNGPDSMPSHILDRLNKLKRVGFPFQKINLTEKRESTNKNDPSTSISQMTLHTQIGWPNEATFPAVLPDGTLPAVDLLLDDPNAAIPPSANDDQYTCGDVCKAAH
ncbi:helicase domain protein [Nitzschia inconspicua]|uniref:Helicase domain protein n=1 Tax=Nitzschia inconspicua TaxID=303405 RepID=A0A9K3LDN6_9STRA|nr:helicase domain protein [Nitzschia inconspicua]